MFAPARDDLTLCRRAQADRRRPGNPVRYRGWLRTTRALRVVRCLLEPSFGVADSRPRQTRGLVALRRRLPWRSAGARWHRRWRSVVEYPRVRPGWRHQNILPETLLRGLSHGLRPRGYAVPEPRPISTRPVPRARYRTGLRRRSFQRLPDTPAPSCS